MRARRFHEPSQLQLAVGRVGTWACQGNSAAFITRNANNKSQHSHCPEVYHEQVQNCADPTRA